MTEVLTKRKTGGDGKPLDIVTFDDIEHAHHASDMYIGQTLHEACPPVDRFVWDEKEQRMVWSNIQYPAGLLKLYDEALVNAADNVIRGTKRIHITVTDTTVTIHTNGQAIQVLPTAQTSLADPSQKALQPEVAFFHMRSSSNYHKQKRCTGGKYGLGAKMMSIFSTYSKLELCDGQTYYSQETRNHMRQVSAPSVKSRKSASSFLRITFTPDLSMFYPRNTPAPTAFSCTVKRLFHTRALDIAGTTPKRVKVYYNSQVLPVSDFKSYVRLYWPETVKSDDTKTPTPVLPKLAYCENERWQVCALKNPFPFKCQVSFVNNINTVLGGQHVKMIRQRIYAFCSAQLSEIDSRRVEQAVLLFVNAKIEDPTFDSASKNRLMSPPSVFGSRIDPPSGFFNVFKRNGVLAQLKEALEIKHMIAARGKIKAKRAKSVGHIKYFRDARFAGTRQSQRCTIYLTEGVSAFKLAEVGLSVIKSDYNGALSLRGKVINAEANVAKLAKDAEFVKICRVLGLELGNRIERQKLRYGRVVFLTDQDHDASHIQALLLWMFAVRWPNLLRERNFLFKMITPILVATKGATRMRFYTLPAYKQWWNQHVPVSQQSRWHIKYYKGLATSSTQEGRFYFEHLDQLLRPFEPASDEDLARLRMAMATKQSRPRQVWLAEYNPQACLQYDELKSISIRDFVDLDLKHYSWVSIQRGIAAAEDGLTKSARKCLWAFMQKKYPHELKVATAQGEVDKNTNYHYGPDSLGNTLVRMAQQFTGKQNINLFQPRGQFGSRVDGGADRGSSRYIFTALQPIARLLFPEADDPVLNVLTEEGKKIEPKVMAPIIPMILVNGAVNVATGFASKVPCYRPEDLIARVRASMPRPKTGSGAGFQVTTPLTPWYHKWKGTLQESVPQSGTFVSYGQAAPGPKPNQYFVTELPIRVWRDDYKTRLEKLAYVKTIHENHPTPDTINFEVFTEKPLANVVEELELKAKFTANLTLLVEGPGGTRTVRRFQIVDEVFDYWFECRRQLYQARKQHWHQVWRARVPQLEQKLLFLQKYVDQQVNLRLPRPQLIQQLVQCGIHRAHCDDFLRMPINSLTPKRIQAVQAELAAARAQVQYYQSIHISELWEQDLDKLAAALPAFYRSREQE